MIEKITIDGFKSLKNVTIEIKPLTVLIGLNSSGKSSVLQLLAVLKQCSAKQVYANQLVTRGDLVNLGDFEDVVRKEGKKEIGVEIAGGTQQQSELEFLRAIRYNYSFTVDAMGLRSYDFSMAMVGSMKFDGSYDRDEREQRDIQLRFDEENILFFRNQPYIARPLQFTGVRGNLFEEHLRVLQYTIPEIIATDLSSFFFVPAARGMSSPSYPLDERASDDLVDVSNLSKQAVKLSSTMVYESPSIQEKINKWIRRITGVAVRARTIPNKNASIEVAGKFNVNVVNEGFGSNQLIHLFAQIARAPVSSLIGIEEPEAHLHPKAQSEMASVLMDIAKQEKKNLIMTTHSEHILYRFLIEVARGKLKQEDFVIYHFRLADDGTTIVERLNVDEKGRLDKGIPDFLETDLSEFKGFLEALGG